MKARDAIIGRSMPRKKQHGTKMSRWTTHQECKARSTRATYSKRDVPLVDREVYNDK